MQRRNQVGEANAWLTHYRGTDRQGDICWHWWGRFPQVISQETQILDIYPVNLLRRKHLVGKTKLSSVGFSWRAKPGAIWPLLVAKGHFLRQLDQILLHLALNPARILLAQHKKVWSMPGRDIARIVLAAILQFDLACGLTVQFQNVGIVVDQVGKGEFISMALKLDRKPHFEGGICPADIPSRTAHPAGWRGCANVGNDCFRLVDQAKPPTPHSHRSEEHTSELQSPDHLVCRLLLEKKKKTDLYPKITEDGDNLHDLFRQVSYRDCFLIHAARQRISSTTGYGSIGSTCATTHVAPL